MNLPLLGTSPRQNRVDPWSHLVATPARGLWMGNRGCLHDDTGRIVRDYQVIRWIICRLEFRGRKREIMRPGHYTELFFLDEATALAAGHRPCAECQCDRYQLFLDFWAKTQNSTGRVDAKHVDTTLHAARWVGSTRQGHKVTYVAPLADLPDGTIIATSNDCVDADAPYLIVGGQLWRWSFDGYTPGPQWSANTLVRVLTPRPTVAILAAGYPCQLHPSLGVSHSA